MFILISMIHRFIIINHLKFIINLSGIQHHEYIIKYNQLLFLFILIFLQYIFSIPKHLLKLINNFRVFVFLNLFSSYHSNIILRLTIKNFQS
jgi:hypothetical protein